MKNFNLVKRIVDSHVTKSEVNHSEAFKSALADIAAQNTGKVITRKKSGEVKKTSLRKRQTIRSKSELKNFVSDAIASRQFKRPEIVALATEAFSSDAESARKIAVTVRTYLSDSKNPRYCSFKALAREDEKTGIFSFVD